MNRPIDRWNRLALVAAMMAALGLGACGRKGGLDPPPSAGLATPQSYTSRPSLGDDAESNAPAPPGERARPQGGASAAATASPPPKKSFFLDFLIDK